MVDRDFLTFFYESPQSFTAECSSCSGPSALNYAECESTYCPYGYDSESGKCWSVDCPYGDCVDPDAEESKEEPPEPDDEEEENNDKIEALLGDIIRELQDPDITREDIQLQTTELKTALTNLSNDNKSSSDEVVAAVKAVEAAVKAIDGNVDVEVPEFDDGDLIDAINNVKETSISNRCAQTGKVYVAPPSPEGTGSCQDPAPSFEYSDLDKETISGLPDAIKETSIGQSVASITEYQIQVSSVCGGAFVYSLPTSDLPLINQDMSINLCTYLDPITPFLRIIALMFWTILALRIILDA